MIDTSTRSNSSYGILGPCNEIEAGRSDFDNDKAAEVIPDCELEKHLGIEGAVASMQNEKAMENNTDTLSVEGSRYIIPDRD